MRAPKEVYVLEFRTLEGWFTSVDAFVFTKREAAIEERNRLAAESKLTYRVRRYIPAFLGVIND